MKIHYKIKFDFINRYNVVGKSVRAKKSSLIDEYEIKSKKKNIVFADDKATIRGKKSSSSSNNKIMSFRTEELVYTRERRRK